MKRNESKVLRAFGVAHTSIDLEASRGEGRLVPSGQAAALFSCLREEGMPAALGIEHVHDEQEYQKEMEWMERQGLPRYADAHRFWKTVYLRAEKNGIGLVSLADQTTDNLRKLNSVLLEAEAEQKQRGSEAIRACLSEKEKEVRDRHPVVARMIRTVMNEFRQMDARQLMRLANAVAVRRSMRMLEEAKNNGLTHLVAGSGHVEHWEKLNRSVQPTYLAAPMVAHGSLESRIYDYRQMKKVVEKLEGIASQEQQD